MKKRILITDDESSLRLLLSCFLENAGFDVKDAENGNDCLVKTREFSPDLILLDLEMPVMDGLETLMALKVEGYQGKIIIMTAYGSIPSTVEAMKTGAFHYMTKPFANEELLLNIEKALEHDKIEKELDQARLRLDEKYSIEGIITRNPLMEKVLETVKRVADSEISVMITGESGTGKELVANALHQYSKRKNKAFIPLNCGSLPHNLIESELFGYRKGAFTGADSSKEGLVERAHGGTLFLDEIGEMGMEAQVKLLRFAQSGEYIPLGDTRSRKVDPRLIAATNRNLEEAIKEGRFRQDLYYRLNVVNLVLPPLRERKEDIPLLVNHFSSKYQENSKKNLASFSPQTMRVLQQHHWPGNIRELENVVNAALVLAAGDHVTPEELSMAMPHEPSFKPQIREGATLQEIVQKQQAEVERLAIVEALDECQGNQTKAARKLGIGRNTLMRKMKKYHIMVGHD